MILFSIFFCFYRQESFGFSFKCESRISFFSPVIKWHDPSWFQVVIVCRKKISVEHPVHVLPLSVPSSSSSPFVGFTLYLYFSLWQKIASKYYPHTRIRVIYLIISVMLQYNCYENQINLNIGNISGKW